MMPRSKAHFLLGNLFTPRNLSASLITTSYPKDRRRDPGNEVALITLAEAMPTKEKVASLEKIRLVEKGFRQPVRN